MKTIPRKALLERKAREFSRKAPTEVFNVDDISSKPACNHGGCNGAMPDSGETETTPDDEQRRGTLAVLPPRNDLDGIRSHESQGVSELGTVERSAT